MFIFYGQLWLLPSILKTITQCSCVLCKCNKSRDKGECSNLQLWVHNPGKCLFNMLCFSSWDRAADSGPQCTPSFTLTFLKLRSFCVALRRPLSRSQRNVEPGSEGEGRWGGERSRGDRKKRQTRYWDTWQRLSVSTHDAKPCSSSLEMLAPYGCARWNASWTPDDMMVSHQVSPNCSVVFAPWLQRQAGREMSHSSVTEVAMFCLPVVPLLLFCMAYFLRR